MRTALLVLLIVHGAIHLLGFVKAFGLAEIAQLQQPISKPLGLLWLLSGLAFLASAVCLLVVPRQWWLVAGPALVLSQIVIVTSWHDARFGTLANVVVLVPLAMSLLELRSTAFRSIYAQDVARGLAREAPASTVTEADLAKLPPLVQTYLRRAGAVGKPRVRDVRTRWRAQMRSKPDAAWMDARADQHDFFDEPARVFLMDASLYGIPFVALHRYVGPAATMQVRVASFVDIVDARGPEMNQSETVTLFNDLCLLAPAALVEARVTWEPIDARSVRGTFTNAGQTIHAVLAFDAQGDLADFVSNDRFLSGDGKKYESFPWSTPIRDYRDFGGRRVASRGETVWKQPAGDYVYGRFEL
ncbi:MAG TPA: DUF6544 family protein, partial [Labilithrix sp.]|nr:DUF6544 family protein [Labilithrix sp.]